jgi:hypothetical protein
MLSTATQSTHPLHLRYQPQHKVPTHSTYVINRNTRYPPTPLTLSTATQRTHPLHLRYQPQHKIPTHSTYVINRNTKYPPTPLTLLTAKQITHALHLRYQPQHKVPTHSTYVINRNTKYSPIPLINRNTKYPPTPLTLSTATKSTHPFHLCNQPQHKRPYANNCLSLHQSGGLRSHWYVLLLFLNSAVGCAAVLSDEGGFVIQQCLVTRVAL